MRSKERIQRLRIKIKYRISERIIQGGKTSIEIGRGSTGGGSAGGDSTGREKDRVIKKRIVSKIRASGEVNRKIRRAGY